MFDINAKKQRNKQKKYYEIFLSPMHGAPPPSICKPILSI